MVCMCIMYVLFQDHLCRKKKKERKEKGKKGRGEVRASFRQRDAHTHRRDERERERERRQDRTGREKTEPTKETLGGSKKPRPHGPCHTPLPLPQKGTQTLKRSQKRKTKKSPLVSLIHNASTIITSFEKERKKERRIKKAGEGGGGGGEKKMTRLKGKGKRKRTSGDNAFAWVIRSGGKKEVTGGGVFFQKERKGGGSRSWRGKNNLVERCDVIL